MTNNASNSGKAASTNRRIDFDTSAYHTTGIGRDQATFPAGKDRDGNELYYFHDEAFLSHNAEASILGQPGESGLSAKTKVPTGVPGHLAHLWEVTLLSREAEFHYFRGFHFLKFQAACLQRASATCRGHVGMVHLAMANLESAHQLRNRLIESNLRLVVSIAKKLAVHSEGFSVDELVSVGNSALLNAVEKFDYRLGYRFSTYAYQAIQRSICGVLQAETKSRARFATDDYDALLKVSRDAGSAHRREIEASEARTAVKQLLAELSPRERLVVMAYFGIEQHAEPRSFQKIASSLGLSKQRVAAIFSHAIRKIRRILKRSSLPTKPSINLG